MLGWDLGQVALYEAPPSELAWPRPFYSPTAAPLATGALTLRENISLGTFLPEGAIVVGDKGTAWVKTQLTWWLKGLRHGAHWGPGQVTVRFTDTRQQGSEGLPGSGPEANLPRLSAFFGGTCSINTG